MHLVIRATNLPVTEAIREHVSTRVLGAVSRFAKRLASITVVIEDVNGPKGGVDIACRIEGELARSGGPVVITARSDDLYRAVDRASGRFKGALRRRAERRKARSPRRKGVG
jgi:putative sigma-54 modulation protein